MHILSRKITGLSLAFFVAQLLVSCAVTEPTFSSNPIPDSVFSRMQGKTFKSDCPLAREDLRYLKVSYSDFQGKTQTGELICHKVIAQDLISIFKELYDSDYRIEKIRLMDEYDADDETAMRDNNTSSFNFRFISGTKVISKHGLGVAVDINTLYNPYVKIKNGKLTVEPATALPYVDRNKAFPYKIDNNDLCYKVFSKYGFEWGGDWKSVKDYQHFELSDETLKKLRLR